MNRIAASNFEEALRSKIVNTTITEENLHSRIFYFGQVIDNKDPKNLNRIKVRIPVVDDHYYVGVTQEQGNAKLSWCLPISSRFIDVPEQNAIVVAAILDPKTPYFGRIYFDTITEVSSSDIFNRLEPEQITLSDWGTIQKSLNINVVTKPKEGLVTGEIKNAAEGIKDKITTIFKKKVDGIKSKIDNLVAKEKQKLGLGNLTSIINTISPQAQANMLLNKVADAPAGKKTNAFDVENNIKYQVGIRGKGKNKFLLEKDYSLWVQNAGEKEEAFIRMDKDVIVNSSDFITLISAKGLKDLRHPILHEELYSQMDELNSLLQKIIIILGTMPSISPTGPCMPTQSAIKLMTEFQIYKQTKYRQFKKNGHSKKVALN